VQKGTVYESWLRRDLVGAGLTAEENLIAYPEIGGAVAALTRGDIDFVVLDLPPAKILDEQVGLSIAGQDLNRQSFAVAVPKGASSLKAEIDRALGQMRGDGTLSRLAWHYLASDILLPTATPTPGPVAPSTPIPPAPQTTTPRPAASATPTVSVTPTVTATITPTATPGTDNPLAGTSWLVTSYYNPNYSGGMASVLSGTSLTAAFASGGGVSGSAGCNSYSGSYVEDGNLLAITPMSSTTMACATPEGIMEQETAFLAALASSGSYAIDGSQLNIMNTSGQLVLLLNGQ
jgi:heat shock protein HslJ